ncbi:SpoVR family protein [Thiothrix fructosivorans]|jgi:spore cortex formation protein SpoVR/YcgB (stage V sporulation)|uniref:SpoVR family protein n=1 Tax=Thiothrix fructosivorans TaxID=111770 RepID=A0A8B0SFN5_9GAMM|nr:SpoVR family protein [Thiothrix fructosivorans]MBO0615194.1 SpoVR family protein [Thiothrix fructosivorans]QTX09981.1 SpoVR family protein [Thiothrix fructosivorans]
MSEHDAEKRYISTSSEWTFETIEAYEREIARIARDKFKLDTYPNQIEMIRSDQMMDAYASIGMPVFYSHWSYGKHFVHVEQNYSRGRMGLAYEIVINSNPCIAYLMEENTMTMQVLVIAHACYGHNSFFKGNYLFRTWTDAEAIIDYLLFAKKYISQCEERYGVEQVEMLLDSCHALKDYGVDRYKRPAPISAAEEQNRQKERELYIQQHLNDLWRTLPHRGRERDEDKVARHFPADPQENLLYFIEKNSPSLETWQREIIRIVRKVSQYFYPQRQTQVMNEGWATFWHYTILNEMYDEGLVNEGFMLEFLSSHTSVVMQPGFDSPYYSGINPYALGFAMMSDIKRICEHPTAEDKQWFPDIAGSDWLTTLDQVMRNYRDESFILQFLSPKVIRDFHFFALEDDDRKNTIDVTAIHNDEGYRRVREKLSQQYNLSQQEPDIQIYNVNVRGDRSLTLQHVLNERRPLSGEVNEMLRHVYRLWGYDVHLHSVETEGRTVRSYHLVSEFQH